MTLDRKWEKFSGGPLSNQKDQIQVTINRKGLIYLNRKAYGAFGQPKAVAIYYNREADAIALEPAYERVDEHFPVLKRQTGWGIHASTFCRHHRIRIPNTERFIRPDLTKDGQMILNLRETVTVGGVVKKSQNRER